MRGFNCANCGRLCFSNRPEEEAEREYQEQFSDALRADPEGRAVVCSDCYTELTTKLPPAEANARYAAKKRGES